jgi:hypothetical protein
MSLVTPFDGLLSRFRALSKPRDTPGSDNRPQRKTGSVGQIFGPWDPDPVCSAIIGAEFSSHLGDVG